MYPKESFIHDCQTVFKRTEGNIVDIPDIGSVVLYDAPIIGFADSSDELFERFRNPEIIGSYYFAPNEWLPSANLLYHSFCPLRKRFASVTDYIQIHHQNGCMVELKASLS